MAKPYSIVPPRQPLGFVDGKPVEITREWWRFLSSLFTTTGSGQPGGGGDDDLNDLFNLAFSTIEPAGTDVDSRFNEIDLLLQAGRSESAAEPVSPDADTLMLLTGHRVQGPDPRVDVLLSAGRQAQAQEPRADLLLPAVLRGTDFDAVTAELRKLIMAIRPQRVPSGSDLGLGTMAFQNANSVAITGGTINGTVVGGTAAAAGTFTTITGASLSITGSIAQNLVYAAPAGAAGAPSFRALVGADLPNPSSTTLGGTQSIAAVVHKFLTSISTAGVPASAQPAAADLSDGVTGTGTVVLSASPVLSGTVTGTYTLGGTPTLAAGTLSGITTLPGSGQISAAGFIGVGMVPANPIDITLTQNATSRIKLVNASVGISCAVLLNLQNSTNSYSAGIFGTGFTPSGMFRADGAIVSSNGATGGLTLGTGAVQPVYFATNNAVAGQFDGAGNFITLNGVSDQSFSYQTPATGFAITVAAGVRTLILEPAAALATGTVTMPAAPVNGQELRLTSTQNIVALTVSPNTGQTVRNAPTGFTVSLTGDQGYEFIYRAANTTWYRLQ